MAIKVEKFVEASADDAHETSAGVVKINTKEVEFGAALAGRRVGFLFKNINVPSGATITTATFSIWVPAGATKLEMKAAIFPNDEAAPASFTEAEKNISGRERPKHYTEWGAKMTAGAYNSIALSPELVEYMVGTQGNKGWVKNNSIGLEITSPQTGCEVTIEMWDNLKATTHAAKLVFEYEPPMEMQTLC